MILTGRFAPRSPISWSNNLLSNSRGRKELKKAMERFFTGTAIALDWSHLKANISKTLLSKQANRPIRYWEIRLVKKRLLVLVLVMYYFRDVQHN